MTQQFEPLLDAIASKAKPVSPTDLRSQLARRQRRNRQRGVVVVVVLIALAGGGLVTTLIPKQEAVVATQPDPRQPAPETSGLPPSTTEPVTSSEVIGDGWWIPVERTAVPTPPPGSGAIGEAVKLTDDRLKLWFCDRVDYAISWQDDGFTILEERIPEETTDAMACGERTGIAALPVQPGDFVTIAKLESQRYRLTSEEWSLIIEPRS